MVKGKFISGQDDLSEIMKIRKEVFGENRLSQARENMPDDKCMHVIAYNEGDPAAAGSIYYDGWKCVIYCIAVRQDCRGQGLGDFVVRMLIDRALMANVPEISADVPNQIKGFFEKIGFHEEKKDVKNVKYTEQGYIKMKLDKTDLNKCCDCHE